MASTAIKSLVICAFGAATIAGCASSPSSSATASAQKGVVQSGKVAAVETTAVVDQATLGSSSGGSTTVTTVSGGPALVTVSFDDGGQGRYIIENPSATHTVGEPVYVITHGDRTAIMPRSR